MTEESALSYNDLKKAYFDKYNQLGMTGRSRHACYPVASICSWLWSACDEPRQRDPIHTQVVAYVKKIECSSTLTEWDQLFLLSRKLIQLAQGDYVAENEHQKFRSHYILHLLLKFYGVSRSSVLLPFSGEAVKLNYPLVYQVLKENLVQLKQATSAALELNLHPLETSDINIIRVKELESSHKGSLGIPAYFICPLSHSIMTDPVVLTLDGFTYDRSYIEDYLFYNPHQSPKTGASISANSQAILVKNENLAAALSDFCKQLCYPEKDSAKQLLSHANTDPHAGDTQHHTQYCV